MLQKNYHDITAKISLYKASKNVTQQNHTQMKFFTPDILKT